MRTNLVTFFLDFKPAAGVLYMLLSNDGLDIISRLINIWLQFINLELSAPQCLALYAYTTNCHKGSILYMLSA